MTIFSLHFSCILSWSLFLSVKWGSSLRAFDLRRGASSSRAVPWDLGLFAAGRRLLLDSFLSDNNAGSGMEPVKNKAGRRMERKKSLKNNIRRKASSSSVSRPLQRALDGVVRPHNRESAYELAQNVAPLKPYRGMSPIIGVNFAYPDVKSEAGLSRSETRNVTACTLSKHRVTHDSLSWVIVQVDFILSCAFPPSCLIKNI